MFINKKRVLMKALIESRFGYCPLIWMFHSRGVNNKINHLHERSLRIDYEDSISSFQDLLKRDKSLTVHQSNIQSLAIESQSAFTCSKLTIETQVNSEHISHLVLVLLLLTLNM